MKKGIIITVCIILFFIIGIGMLNDEESTDITNSPRPTINITLKETATPDVAGTPASVPTETVKVTPTARPVATPTATVKEDAPMIPLSQLGWNTAFRLPSQTEIEAYNKTSTKRSPYLAGWLQIPQGTRYTEYMIDFKAPHLPKGTYCSLGNWSMDYSYLKNIYQSTSVESGGINAYAGFQCIDTGEKVSIMSFWDVFCKDYNGNETILRPKRVYPASTDFSEDFTGEGTGAHCTVRYNWQADHWYRMHLKCTTSQTTGNTVVEQWVADLATGKYTLLCSYDVGVPNSAFVGQIGIFLENYLPAYSGNVRSMEVCNAKYLNASTGLWTTITDVYMGPQVPMSDVLGYNGSYDFGIKDGHLWMITSGVGGDWYSDGRGKQYMTLKMN